jgi:cobalt/nickel transport system permease protein
MHISDGILEPAVWAPLAGASVVAVGIAARAAKKRFEDESIALVGVMGAFVFALQMVNFQLAPGVSDHVVGAAILAIVFGVPIAVLAMAAIVTIQAFVFADGGIAALGANVFDMAVISPVVTYVVYKALAGRSRRLAATAATVAGVLAGAAGAAAWVIASGKYGAKFFGMMLILHLASGVIEAIVTVAVLEYLAKARVARPGKESASA